MRSFHTVILLFAGTCLSMVPAALAAQTERQGLAVERDTSRRFSVAAQPLAAGLAELGRQGGVRIVVRGALPEGLSGQALDGWMTVEQAISRLLAGTPLRARFQGDATIVVSHGDAHTDAPTLAGVVVRDRGARAGYAAPAASAASKLEGPLRDLPQSISVVGRAVIADQSMRSMADVVRYIPGVGMAQGEGHRDAPVIRGNASTADFFVDGMRDDGQYLRDLYNVERIEALKGANAMTFGRGGGGGVLNRVTKMASWTPTRELTLSGGSYDHRRGAGDVGGTLGSRAALRLNGVLEQSALFRDATRLERVGLNPSAALALGDRTMLRGDIERFDDRRTVDRGIPSFAGAPSVTSIRTFFGDPGASQSSARVLAGNVSAEHQTAGGVTLRGKLRSVRYDKRYQNVYPGAVDSSGSRVTLLGYSSDILRDNLLTQAEAAGSVTSGNVRHGLLAGVELGVQGTNNFRRTGYFGGGTATSASVDFTQPTVSAPVEFRQSATDADNRVVAHVAGAYVQDQLRFGAHVQAVAGLRIDRFALDFRNHRDAPSFARTDRAVSPRVGLVVKPAEPLSVYAAYSVSHLPSAGDQFSSLSATTSTLEPERFTNREVGLKWDASESLGLTVAAYRLDRTNTSAPDPLDSKRLVQTGRQRSSGIELGVSGAVTPRWQVQGGLAAQRAEIVERTSAAAAGARVPLVPRGSASLWNRVQLTPAVGAGLGVIHQGSSFAAIDNTVTLPGYTRADAAFFATIGRGLRGQVNVENLFGTRYFASAQGNNNILPGAPRLVRVSLVKSSE
jgi:catecholate siderophore receptor